MAKQKYKKKYYFGIASQKYGSTASFAASSEVKHTCFFLGWHTPPPHTHTPPMNIHTPSLLPFSRQPREIVKTLDLQWRDGECVKERMVGKESTDFNSQNS